MRILQKNRGFTLIELLVVISIIGILASVILASLSVARSKARDSVRFAQMKELTNALELYYVDNKTYPGVNNPSRTYVSQIGGLAPEYIPELPEDPIHTGPQRYRYTATARGYTILLTLENTRHPNWCRYDTGQPGVTAWAHFPIC